MESQLIPANTLDIVDVAGQLSTRSRRIYQNDAQVFAVWLRDQGLTPDTLSE